MKASAQFGKGLRVRAYSAPVVRRDAERDALQRHTLPLSHHCTVRLDHQVNALVPAGQRLDVCGQAVIGSAPARDGEHAGREVDRRDLRARPACAQQAEPWPVPQPASRSCLVLVRPEKSSSRRSPTCRCTTRCLVVGGGGTRRRIRERAALAGSNGWHDRSRQQFAEARRVGEEGRMPGVGSKTSSLRVGQGCPASQPAAASGLRASLAPWISRLRQ
jgi:hypothetical protein